VLQVQKPFQMEIPDLPTKALQTYAACGWQTTPKGGFFEKNIVK